MPQPDPIARDPNVNAAAARPLLSTRALTKTYGSGSSEVRALQAVDLDLMPGELIVLLGPSGSGKSTLLNIMGGLDTPTSGHVYFGDKELTTFNEAHLTRFRRDSVGFVFQFYNLIASLTAEENVALVTEIARAPMRPLDALDMVGLSNRAGHFPSELSGGEQQRVAIARAIAKRPEILLCDEPTGALDSETGILVLEAIERVNRELGAATALITHNQTIASMAHRVISMADGRIVDVVTNATRQSPRNLSW